jgi:hypothetical protein
MLFSNILLNKVMLNIANTSISIILILICSSTIYYVFINKFDTNKSKKKFRSRIAYVSIFIFLLVLAKIWVDGFAHIFTLFSLVAAGLVITNKDTIMNLVGWLIINWRGLFVEGDFIQILNYKGYVSSVGIFHFNVYETISLEQAKATGYTIRIPNGLIIQNPVYTFSPDTNLKQYTINYNIKINNNIINIKKFINQAKDIIENIITKRYSQNYRYSYMAIHRKNKNLSQMIDFSPYIFLTIANNDILTLVINYYAFPVDKNQIEFNFWSQILEYYSLLR